MTPTMIRSGKAIHRTRLMMPMIWPAVARPSPCSPVCLISRLALLPRMMPAIPIKPHTNRLTIDRISEISAFWLLPAAAG